MARKQVVEIQCDRCVRVEHRTVADDDIHTTSFKGQMGPEVPTTFEDLCTPCLNTVRSHMEQITKKLTGLSPDRAVKPTTETPIVRQPKALKQPDLLPKPEKQVDFPRK